MATPSSGINGTLSNGLIGHWSFDNSFSGTGGTLLVCDGTLQFTADMNNNVGGAIIFNGKIPSPYLAAPSTGSFPGSIYLSAWVKTGAVFDEVSIFRITVEPYFAYTFLLGINNTGCCIRYGADVNNLTEVAISSIDSNFHNYILCINAGSGHMDMFIDNILVKKITFSNTGTVGAPYSVYIGYGNSIPYRYSIVIDEVRIGSRILTGIPINEGSNGTGEIAEIYNMGVNYQADKTPPIFNTANIDTITATSANLNINANENATVYYQIRESPIDNAKIGDILIEPEAGWTRYYSTDTSMFIIEEYGFRMKTAFREKLKVGDKLRIIYPGNILNDIFEVWAEDPVLINDCLLLSYADMVSVDIILPIPTSIELKTSNDGTIVLTENVTNTQSIASLANNTQYDLYIVAEDTVGNLQANPFKIEFKTLDGTPPNFLMTTLSAIGINSCILNISTNENSMAYYKIYTGGVTPPTSAELKATNDGVISLSANLTTTKLINRLTQETNYNLYIVAEDSSLNLQESPTKISFKTLDIGSRNKIYGVLSPPILTIVGDTLTAYHESADYILISINNESYIKYPSNIALELSSPSIVSAFAIKLNYIKSQTSTVLYSTQSISPYSLQSPLIL